MDKSVAGMVVITREMGLPPLTERSAGTRLVDLETMVSESDIQTGLEGASETPTDSMAASVPLTTRSRFIRLLINRIIPISKPRSIRLDFTLHRSMFHR